MTMKNQTATYPLPQAVIDDLDGYEYSLSEISARHGIGIDSLRRVIFEHYDYDIAARRREILRHKAKSRAADHVTHVLENRLDEVLDALDNTDMTVQEISKHLGIPARALRRVIQHIGYNTESRGHRIRLIRESPINSMESPMCSISREWLAKPWTTNNAA